VTSQAQAAAAVAVAERISALRRRRPRVGRAEAIRLAARAGWLLEVKEVAYRRLLALNATREADRRFVEAVGTAITAGVDDLDLVDVVRERFAELELDHDLEL